MRDLDIIERWESRVPDDDEPTNPCCECGSESDFEIDGRVYCKYCAEDLFKHLDDDTQECESCGEIIEAGEAYFTINSEIFCRDCFEEIFQI